MHRSTVLVVEDDAAVAELIRRTLTDGGFDVIYVPDGAAALDVAWNHKPDVLVLDVGLPGIDGLEVCRRLRADRRSSTMPVLMLSARDDVADRVVGLELGADDYVIKPFSPREVLARVKTLMRRVTQSHTGGDVIRHGRIVIDAQRHEVSYDGQPIALTATEFRVLQYMASTPGRSARATRSLPQHARMTLRCLTGPLTRTSNRSARSWALVGTRSRPYADTVTSCGITDDARCRRAPTPRRACGTGSELRGLARRAARAW
jgi:DNA-binding response OmpR family regulator